MIMAMTVIGSSHLVLCPVAGAKYGFALLWIVLLAHIIKYPAFEFGPRYTLATGEPILLGYRKLPGPKNWLIYLIMVMGLVLGFCGLSAVVGTTGAVLHAATGIPLPLAGPLVAISVLLMLVLGKYWLLENINKWMLGTLVIVALIAFFYSTPTPTTYASSFIIPVIPLGATTIVAALLGWLPGDMSASVLHSTWAMEKWKGAKSKDTLKEGLFDFRVGYAVIFIMACVFMILGAVTLYPRGLVPSGENVIVTISMIFTNTIGSWMYPLIMIVAFFIMFSTSYAAADGASRLLSWISAILWESYRSKMDRTRTILAVLFCVVPACITFFLPEPVLLIMIAAIMSLFFAPLVYLANTYCVTRLIDNEMKPPKITVAASVLGFVLTTASIILFISVIF